MLCSGCRKNIICWTWLLFTFIPNSTNMGQTRKKIRIYVFTSTKCTVHFLPEKSANNYFVFLRKFEKFFVVLLGLVRDANWFGNSFWSVLGGVIRGSFKIYQEFDHNIFNELLGCIAYKIS